MNAFSSRAVASLAIAAAFGPGAALAQTDFGAPSPGGYNCLLFPEDDTALAQPVREVVVEKLVRPGDSVSSGDPLLRFAAGGLPAQVDKAALELAHARRKQDRAAALGGMQTAAERDEAETATATAAAALRELELELDKHTLRAPHDGVVIDVPVSVGETVGDGPAVRLVRLDRLRAELDMPSEVFGRFASGDALTLTDEAGQARAGEVIFVEPLIDPASRTFRVHVRVDNTDRGWIAGGSCGTEGF